MYIIMRHTLYSCHFTFSTLWYTSKSIFRVYCSFHYNVIINDNGGRNKCCILQNKRFLLYLWMTSHKQKWFFMLLHEYPAIARHHFYGGNLPIHKAIQNKCCFQIIENRFRHDLNHYKKETMESCPCTLHACIFPLTTVWELSFYIPTRFDHHIQ